MKIINCPYCNGTLKKGKLVYRFEFRTPKIIFDDGSEKKLIHSILLNMQLSTKFFIVSHVRLC
jgi:hypothetical protein